MEGRVKGSNRYMNMGALSPYYPDKQGHGDYGPIQLAATQYYTVRNRNYPYPPDLCYFCARKWPCSDMRPETRACSGICGQASCACGNPSYACHCGWRQ
jgi:hypothetical protein